MREKTYRIGEAADMLRLKSYVLRFWETEFPQLAPLRTDKGQRLYTDYHIALLHRIRQLLHEQGMTIEGARRVLASAARTEMPLDTAHYMPAGAYPAPSSVSSPVPNPADYPSPTGGQAVPMPLTQVAVPPQTVPPAQPVAGVGLKANGHNIDSTVVREMRDELLALRNMLLADD